MNPALLSAEVSRWGTPQPLFDKLNREFKFTVDAAAEPWSAKCKRYWTEKADGLHQPRGGERPFDNPPYDQAGDFVHRERQGARREGAIACMVLPARPDTRWWQQLIWGPRTLAGWRKLGINGVGATFVETKDLVTGLLFLPGRQKFILPPDLAAKRRRKTTSAPFPTALVVFAPPRACWPKIPLADEWLTMGLREC